MHAQHVDGLLREPRRALHARIAETLEGRFADTAETQPELLERHCTEAGLIEKAAGLWGKAGQRSLARAALLEGAEQLRRALDQIATFPATPDLRREEIKLRVAFANALALTGDFVQGKEHYDRALAIYDPAEHRPIATSSGRDVGVTLLSFRSACLWIAAKARQIDRHLLRKRQIPLKTQMAMKAMAETDWSQQKATAVLNRIMAETYAMAREFGSLRSLRRCSTRGSRLRERRPAERIGFRFKARH